MLFLCILFGAALLAIAKTPKEIMQMGLAAAWVLMAASCAGSAVYAILR